MVSRELNSVELINSSFPFVVLLRIIVNFFVSHLLVFWREDTLSLLQNELGREKLEKNI